MIKIKKYLSDALVIAMVASIIYIPVMPQLLGLTLLSNKFDHIDGFLMASAWSYASGLVLNVDVISQYSVTIPALITIISKWIGGLTYERAVWLVMMSAIFYFGALYLLARYWLESFWLAIGVVILAIKWQMFHQGILPNIWWTLSPSVIRFWWDLAVLFLCLRYSQTLKVSFLVWSCVFCGVALAWFIDTGIYLTVAVYGFMGLIWLMDDASNLEKMKKLRIYLVLMFVPGLVALLVLFLVQGWHVFNPEFWNNMFEHAGLFLKGWGSIPMSQSISDGDIRAGIVGFTIPVIYVWTMLVIAGLCLLRKLPRENIFVVFLCIYGLGLFHYYVNRSGTTSYHCVCIPLVLILFFWVKQVIPFIQECYRTYVVAALAFVLLVLLTTNNAYLLYPNIFNAKSLNTMLRLPQARALYENFSFSDDAALIQRLCKEDVRVPVISPFENWILMEAHRKPFFYYYPLMAYGNWTYVYTKARFYKTIAQLNTFSPMHIFVNKEIWMDVPSDKTRQFEGLTAMMKYIKTNYEIAEEGKTLVALKIK